MGSPLRIMRREDLSSVLEWRNRPEVRSCMLTQHEIRWDEHCAWFERASRDPRKRLFIFEQEGSLGFAHLSCINATVAEWGFYLAAGAKKGAGTLLGLATLRYAFEELALHKVAGQALADNSRSIALHHKLGFRREGELRDHHFDGEQHCTLICFGLLQQEWYEKWVGQNE
ncbi:MAG: UDP-4-amino-4,6-dideoxy-N-acetyl-beta-L-altrosamine N-acetyltransferase [Gammaproteobacteria bacterium]|nr:UDP-4-amino-4,6-dideoxy-N-acetyl-beta-L-altrosamine N-acetyltransferase [Gammaproteobacteria bacterium]